MKGARQSDNTIPVLMQLLLSISIESGCHARRGWRDDRDACVRFCSVSSNVLASRRELVPEALLKQALQSTFIRMSYTTWFVNVSRNFSYLFKSSHRHCESYLVDLQYRDFLYLGSCHGFLICFTFCCWRGSDNAKEGTAPERPITCTMPSCSSGIPLSGGVNHRREIFVHNR